MGASTRGLPFAASYSGDISIMAERTIYTCDICKSESSAESEKAMPRGPLYMNIMMGNLCFAKIDFSDRPFQHICNDCLDTITDIIRHKFMETIDKLSA